ncbi:MAG: hypothetical protein AB7N80_03390 [Bdellovibrionales bacterium]
MGFFSQVFLATLFAAVGVAQATDLPARDQDFGCIERNRAEAYVNDFNINLNSFGGMELCNANVDSKKLFNDLQIVEEGQFSGTQRNMFIRDVIPTRNYFGWLKEQTAGVRRGHDMPTATAYNSGGYFTMQDGWAKLSTLGRVGTLIHEARHTEGYSHTQCTQGPYKGAFMSGCDTSLAQQGSHGVEMEYYSRVVLQGQNFHPVYKQMARLMNLGRANFVFNQDPMQQREGLVAQAGEEVVVIDDNGEAQVAHLPGAEDYRLKRTSFGATFYKDDQALAVDLYSSQSGLLGDEYSYYKLLLDGRLSGVADMQEVDVNNRRFLVALTKTGKLHGYVYSEGRWSNPVNASDVVALVTTAPNGQEGLFTVNSQGEVHALEPGTLRRGALTSERWASNVVDFVKWNNQHLSVDQSGQVLDVASGKAYTPMARWKVQQLVKAPLYNAFEL